MADQLGQDALSGPQGHTARYPSLLLTAARKLGSLGGL